MNYKEAVAKGYEMLAGNMSEKFLAEIQEVAMNRLIEGWEVVIVKSKYHDEVNYTLMVKR